MVTVSICIPTYNQVYYLAKTIESIFQQTYRDFEIIIVDDSSTEIVKNYVIKISQTYNIKYFKNEKTLGAPVNWNNAISLSSGKYIKFMHHDDFFTTAHSLRKFVDLLDENTNVNFAFSSSKVIRVNTSESWIHKISEKELHHLKNDPYCILYKNIVGGPSATIIRNNIDVRFNENLQWLVDADFYIAHLLLNKNFVSTDEPLVATISGADHNLTNLCEDDFNIDFNEHLYLLKKVPLIKIFTNIKYLLLLKKLINKHKVSYNKFIQLNNDSSTILLLGTLVFFLYYFEKRY